ncbi:dipeptidase [Treponema sp. TIM-1]|uniref:dipeptidase n=1 Tax=Treponema sp. TIM-1 TaxID=2898417 RepID=UPI00397F6808
MAFIHGIGFSGSPSPPAIDLHCDSVGFLGRGIDLRQENPQGHVDLPRLRRGAVGLQVFAAFVPSSTVAAFSAALEMLDRIDEFAASDPLLVSVETAEESIEAIARGQTAVLRAVENGLAIEDSLDNLAALRRRKVRIMTLVHLQDLSWAASCTGTGSPLDTGDTGGGLSRFGKEVVAAMNDLGMIVDLSHGAESTFWDVLGVSKKPVIASHSCAYSLCASPRNLKDDQIKALGDSGGLIGVCFFPAFLSEGYRRALGADFAAQGEDKDKLADAMARHPVPFSMVADHIDHMVRLAGEDCVGIGSDFDGVFSLPLGVGGCDCYPLLADELRQRGYTEERIQKIFNGNFLRIFHEFN